MLFSFMKINKQPMIIALFIALLINAQSLLSDNSSQMILVLTTTPNEFHSSLVLLEKTGNKWIEKDRMKAVIGRNGLAWGRGLFTLPEQMQMKAEGDGRSPAGVFHLGEGFSKTDTLHTQWPFFVVHEYHRCVDDPQSTYYNSLLDENKVFTKDWQSAENLRMKENYYDIAVVVEHNMHPIEKGSGSCIFLHIWNNYENGTAGCVAVSADKMLKIARWLDPEKNPRIAILTSDLYDKYGTQLELPKIKVH